jgi:hypothetical protein
MHRGGLRLMSSVKTQWLKPDAWCALVFVAACELLLFVWPALPVQDAPLWIYEGSLLRDVLAGRYGGPCHLVSALPPNAFAQPVIALLCTVLAPETAGRVYLGACVAAFAAGLSYLCRARDREGRSSALPLCLPLCVGYPLFHGFLNYMAALPVLCFGVGALLRNPEARGARGMSSMLLLPLFAYVCHGTAFGIWCVILALQWWVTRSRAFALRAALGLAPVSILIALYVAQRSAEGANVSWLAGSVAATAFYRGRSPFRFFSVFQGLAPTFDDPLLRAVAPLCVALNLSYAAAISCYGLWWAWRARASDDRAERLLALGVLALAALFVLMPHDVAKMLNPAERLLVPAAALGAAGASRTAARRRWPAYALLAAQWLYLAVFGSEAARAAVALRAERARLGDDVRVLRDDGLPLSPSAAKDLPLPVALLTRHQVLAMQGVLTEYAHGHGPRPFATGLFRCPPSAQRPSDLASLRASRSPLIVVGDSARAHALARELAPEQQLTHAGTGFWTFTPKRE